LIPDPRHELEIRPMKCSSILSVVLFAILIPTLSASAQTAPADPSWLRVTAASCSEVDLLWEDNSSDEQGFRVERKEGAAGPWTLIASVGENVVSYRDSGLSANTTYAYRVWAFNAAGDSGKTNEANTTTPACSSTPPGDPSWLRVTAASCSEIDLLWDDNSSDEDGFRIERKTGAAGPWTLIASVGANTITYRDSGLAANTTYAYRVWAFNAGGASGKTNEANTTTSTCSDTQPPDAATSLEATVSSATEIDLTWQDASDNEDGFRIERQPAGGLWTTAATVGVDTTSYRDTGLSCATDYTYRIVAFNLAGDATPSPEADATTLACSSPPPDDYPLAPGDVCGSGMNCDAVIDLWNTATWTDVVADDLEAQGNLATVRKYLAENNKVLSPPPGCPLSTQDDDNFCSVTDEHSNVLLNHAMGSDQVHYNKLHRFSELLRDDTINDLQCWAFKVEEGGAFSTEDDVCIANDSAADASLRILGAYGIACAKQRSGNWIGGPDYCTDYDQQALAIFGSLLPGGTGHGEIKLAADGRYYLAGGYDNYGSAPDGTDHPSFWPDYHELQFLMDYARYSGSAVVEQAVTDLLENFRLSLAGGSNHVSKGKRGRFDLTTNPPTYHCMHVCDPPYMDFPDAWRAVPALSGLLNVHPGAVPLATKAEVYDYWWDHYAGGSTSYPPDGSKPLEISWEGSPAVRSEWPNYVTTSMWIPLAAAQRDATYTAEAIRYLIENRYDATSGHFNDATFYGSYASQFAQRAIGAATGMIDPAQWCPTEFQ
jgi:hypothetical protein